LDNIEEMDKFLDAYKLQKLKQEDINCQNRCIAENEIEAVMKSFPTKRSLGLDGFTADFIRPLKKN
jgi:hypothetical protein